MTQEDVAPAGPEQADERRGNPAVFEGLTTADRPEPPEKPIAGPPEAVEVVPLEESRDSSWVLTVPNVSEATDAQKWMKKLRSQGQIQLPDDLITRIAQSAIFPAEINGQKPRRRRTEHGWLATIDARLLIPLVNVSVANDRWVADAVYQADPKFTGQGDLVAVPMPDSDDQYALLRYSAPTLDLLGAAEKNYKRILSHNRQDVGRRLIELPVTLVATSLGTSGAGEDTTELAAVDGNSRISSAFAELAVPLNALPRRVRNTYRDGSVSTAEQTIPVTPALLSNLTVRERRDIAKDLVKQAYARLEQPRKTPESNDYLRDLHDLNKAAITLNVMTVPAQIIVGFSDDEPDRYGMARFASAVRAFLMQMNVEPTSLGEPAKNAIEAEGIAEDFKGAGLIDSAEYDVLVGREGVFEGMKSLSLDPELPDLRAAFVIKTLCETSAPAMTILRERLRRRVIRASDRSRPAVELALRSYTAALSTDDFHKARTALEKGGIWPDLVNKNWEVRDIASDDDVDVLALYAAEQLEGGPLNRLLGVLGMFALVTTGNLLAARGSAESLVNEQAIDRGPVSAIVNKVIRHQWGVTLLADAIKRARAGNQKLRWVDPQDPMVLVDAPEGWRGSDFDAHLRLAANDQKLPEAFIPGGVKEQHAWSMFASAVENAKTKLTEFIDLRKENGTSEPLSWTQVEPTVNYLQAMRDHVRNFSEPQPLER